MTKFSLPIKKEDKKDIVPEIDPAALEAFAAGAQVKSLELEKGAYPWSRFNPNEHPKYNVSVRLNDYHLEMLRYLAKEQDTTQQRILRKQLVPIIEKLAEENFRLLQVK